MNPTTENNPQRPCGQHSSNDAEAVGQDAGVLTLVLWTGCVGIGLFGFGQPYARPRLATPPDPPLVIQQLQVNLTSELGPRPEPPPPSPAPLAVPPAPDPLKLPSVPQLIAVAQPNTANSFALPAVEPTRRVEPGRVEQFQSGNKSTDLPVARPPVPQRLTFGEGEGKQIAPPYPRRALQLRQEGTVAVRLTVNSEGVVQSAEAISPSPWPMLNESALRTVREIWNFRPGPPRVYDVPTRFELTK